MGQSEIMQETSEKSLEHTFPLNIQFYLEPPDFEITLDVFREIAIDRLKVLRVLERIGGKNIHVYSKEWRDACTEEFIVEGLKGYSRLLGRSKTDRSDLEARRKDYISHFILRLVYCRNQDTVRWFIQRELELFRLKLMNCTAAEIKQFLKLNNLNYQPISAEEKNDVLDHLMDSTAELEESKIDTINFFRVPMGEVIDLVRNRKCYLRKGFAYVSANDFNLVLATKQQKILEDGLKFAYQILPYLEEDERMIDLIKNLHTSYTGKDYAFDKSAPVPIESLDQLSKKSFPLCSRYTHDIFRSTHHLKYGGRLQYALFLKGIGVTFNDCLRFWREEFCKKIDEEKFEKNYAYGVRHSFGKAGSMKDYAPHSCQKIITNQVGPQETHGCPFKMYNGSDLRGKLIAYGVSASHAEEVVSFSQKGHYQLACGRYFEITHDTTCEAGINHPVQYFQLSQKIMTDRADIGKKPGTSKSMSNRSYTASQASQHM